MYFRLVNRHAEPGEYVYTSWREIIKIIATTPIGGAVYHEYFDDYMEFYNAEIIGPHEYMVLELIEE